VLTPLPAQHRIRTVSEGLAWGLYTRWPDKMVLEKMVRTNW